MPWTERQRAMLNALGLRVWQPAPPTGAEAHTRRAAAAADEADDDAADDLDVIAVSPPRVTAPTRPIAARAGLALAPAAAREGAVVLPPRIDDSAVAGLDWPALREAVVACRACRLCDSRKQTVFGVGHAQAHWMVVGEAPGAQEDEQGEPFVGAAGQLLDAMLLALGLSRGAEGDPAARVFIANTLKCRPPGNRNPQPDEMQRCEPFLVRQIELVRPRLVLAMGRFAVQALLRTGEPLGRLRGRVHRYQGVPLVVTYHPAYLLRYPADKARAWEDLCLAAEVIARAATAGAAAGEERA